MWIEIKNLKDYIKDREIFVVKAFDVNVHDGSDGYTYTTDPYCVWYEDGKYVRWPHSFKPTHFAVLPANHEK